MPGQKGNLLPPDDNNRLVSINRDVKGDFSLLSFYSFARLHPRRWRRRFILRLRPDLWVPRSLFFPAERLSPLRLRNARTEQSERAAYRTVRVNQGPHSINPRVNLVEAGLVA